MEPSDARLDEVRGGALEGSADPDFGSDARDRELRALMDPLGDGEYSDQALVAPWPAATSSD
eukprot:7969000-Alexandrium_andersonii.AAC.1